MDQQSGSQSPCEGLHPSGPDWFTTQIPYPLPSPQSDFSLKHPVQPPQLALVVVNDRDSPRQPQLTVHATQPTSLFQVPNGYCCAQTHLEGVGPAGCLLPHCRASYMGALGKPANPPSTDRLHSVAPSQSGGLKQSRIFFFFFFGEMIKPGGGDRTSCKKPHPEQASPRLTVNKYSLLAALPSTVRALAPIAFQVQTGKGEKRGRWQIGGLICFLLQFSLVGHF